MTNLDRGFNQLTFLVIKGMILLHALNAPDEVIIGLWFVGTIISLVYSTGKE